MLLVPGQVGLALLFQPEVERTLLMRTEALVGEHVGLIALPYLLAGCLRITASVH